MNERKGKRINRIASLAASFVLVFGLMPMSAFAADADGNEPGEPAAKAAAAAETGATNASNDGAAPSEQAADEEDAAVALGSESALVPEEASQETIAMDTQADAQTITVEYVNAAGVSMGSKECVDIASIASGIPEGGSLELSEGWYAVQGDVSSQFSVVLDGNVNLVLCDGAGWTVQGLSVGGASLTIWGQSAGTGKVTVPQGNGIEVAKSGGLTMNGGTISGEESNIETAVVKLSRGGNLVINGGTLSGKGNGVLNNGGTIVMNGGTIIGACFGNLNDSSESDSYATASAGTVIGGMGAFSGLVKNSVPGKGWSNTEGTGEAAQIEAKPEGQQISTQYKKVQFQASITVAAVPTAGGKVTGSGTYEPGASVALKAKSGKGYKFVSWTEDGQEASTSASYTFVAAGARSLTANFEAIKYTVQFVNDDGTVLQSDQLAYGETPAYTGDTPTKPASDKYTYAFKGWKPKIVPVKGDATYTATYTETPVPVPTEKATLTFDLAGGTLDGKTGSFTVTANVGDTVTIPAAPTREGYAFKYWMGSNYQPGDKYKVEGDHVFTAVWEQGATKHTVTFDANGHGMAPAAQTVEEGKTATKPADPAADGWIFGGWYWDKDGKQAYDFAEPVKANITLYAKWTQKAVPGGNSLAKTGDPFAAMPIVLTIVAAAAIALVLFVVIRRRKSSSADDGGQAEK